MKDALEGQGLLSPLLVRSWDQTYYEIVDGHRRFACAKLLGWQEIETTVREMGIKEMLIAQIRLNNLTISEYRAAILRLNDAFSLDKLPDVGYALGRNVDWVARILGLETLARQPRVAVDKGWINIKVALLLAKLPKGRQLELLDDALTLPSSDLIECLLKEVRHRQESKLDRRIIKKNTGPYLRSEKEILNELNSPLHAMTHLSKGQVTKPFDAWKAALRWALRLDFETLEKFE